MISRRWYAPTIFGLVLAGGGMFFGSSRAWATGRLRTEGLPTDVVTVTGADAHPIVAAMALVIAAAGVAVLSTRGRLRQGVGVIAAGAALVVVGVVLAGRAQLESAFDDAVAQSAAFTGTPPSMEASIWPWLTVVLAALAAVLGVLTVLSSRTWPSMSGRYDAPAAQAPARQTNIDEASGSDLWKAIDDGHDPTA